jgi:myo-inositol-1-phosphate synthase
VKIALLGKDIDEKASRTDKKSVLLAFLARRNVKKKGSGS